MERFAHFLSSTRVLTILFVLVLANGALFLPAMKWIVPADSGITGMPSITHLQLSWTSEQFSHNLAEWSGAACGDPTNCTWAVTAGSGDEPGPLPVADGPAGFKRLTLLLDMSFPVFYSLFAIGLTTRLWDLLGSRRRWLALVVGAGSTAAVCDILENSIHLWLLRGIDTWEQAAAADFPGALVATASMLASVKYGILVLFVLAAVVWLVRWPLVRGRAV